MLGIDAAEVCSHRVPWNKGNAGRTSRCYRGGGAAAEASVGGPSHWLALKQECTTDSSAISIRN